MSPTSSALQAGPRTFEIIQQCHFKPHPCQNCGLAEGNAAHKKKGTCKFKGKMGCAQCGRYKNNFAHLGAPPSLNDNAMMNRHAYNSIKKQWQEILTYYMEINDLPLSMESVSVTARVIFPDQKKRDEGNIRFMLEKAMGDALEAGGWISDDCFYPVRRYTFGQLEAEHRPGVDGVIFTIWPET